MHAQKTNFSLACSNAALARQPDNIAQLSGRSSLFQIPAGQFSKSREAAPAIATIIDGAAKQVASIEVGKEQVLDFLFKGDSWIVWPEHGRLHRIIALVPSSIRVMSLPDLDQVGACDPAALHLIASVSKLTLERHADLLLSLGRRSAEQKVAQFLIEMDARIGTADTGTRRKLVLPMSRSDIGDNLGMTIESVSRSLSHFGRQGVIETQGRHCIYLCDLNRLNCLAG